MLAQTSAASLPDPEELKKPPTMTETTIDQQDPLKSVSGYNPEQVKMEAPDTVESRVAGLIKDDSPLMQLARTKANQSSNQKGLLNSSMAVGAAQKGVMETATPIATSDAMTSKEFKLSNQNAANTAGQFNAGEINKGRSQVYQSNQDNFRLSEQGRIDLQKIAANIEGDSRLINEKGEIDLRLQGDSFNRQTQLQAAKGEIDKQLIGADAEAKKGLNAQMAEIDKELESLKNTHLKQLTDQKAAIDLALQSAAAQDAQVLEKIRGKIDKEIAEISARTSLSTARISASAQIEAAKLNIAGDLEKIKTQGFIDSVLQDSRFKNDVVIQGMANDTQKETARINGEYDVLINSDDNAGNLTGAHNQNITAILLDPNMNPQQKQDAITKTTEIYKASLGVVSLTSGVNYLDAFEGDDAA